jgi:hypothetical protein
VLFKRRVFTAPAEFFLSITTVIAFRHWVGTIRGSKSGELTKGTEASLKAVQENLSAFS